MSVWHGAEHGHRRLLDTRVAVDEILPVGREVDVVMTILGRQQRQARTVVVHAIEARIVRHPWLSSARREVHVLAYLVHVLDLADVPLTRRQLVLQHAAAELRAREIDLAIRDRATRTAGGRTGLRYGGRAAAVEAIQVRPSVALRPPEGVRAVLGDIPADGVKRRWPDLDEGLARVARDHVHRARLRVDRREISTL